MYEECEEGEVVQARPVPASAPGGSPSPVERGGSGPEAAARGPIFRRRAVERYVRGAEEEVLPLLARPRELLWLWLAVGLLTVACLVAGWHLDSVTRRAQAPAQAVEGPTGG